jgi:hypothetical protein
MTLVTTVDINQTAARAALAVPGVTGLQPTLAHLLAHAATRTQQIIGIAAQPTAAGIRAEHTSTPPSWRVEVRCVLHEDHHVLDAARKVREQVRSAVTAHLAQYGTPEPVTILVTVTQIIDHAW